MYVLERLYLRKSGSREGEITKSASDRALLPIFVAPDLKSQNGVRPLLQFPVSQMHGFAVELQGLQQRTVL